jgi:nucleotide-binding universal stress UspA family protein
VNGIIVGLDRSPASAVALRWAVDHGARHGLPVTGLLGWQRDTAGADIDELIAAAVGRDNDVGHRLSAEPEVLALVEAASDAGLVVVGAHQHRWLSELLHTTPCRALMRRATCPIAVVRERALDADDPIVVGLDGSSASRQALAWALDDAATNDRPVVAVHAWTIPSPVDGLPLTSDEVHRRTCAEAHSLERMVAGAADDVVSIEQRSEYGPPVDVLCDVAAEAAVLVFGSCASGSRHRLLFGDVSSRVVREAASTVVIVPPRW